LLAEVYVKKGGNMSFFQKSYKKEKIVQKIEILLSENKMLGIFLQKCALKNMRLVEKFR
jgi:hypothetical protein